MFDLAHHHPFRLRAMIESWDERGLLSPGLAAQALLAQSRRPDPEIQSSIRLRRLETLGYVGAVPVGAAGLLMASSRIGFGSLFLVGLLIALAAPQAVRASTKRPVTLASRPPEPRHRAARQVVPIPLRGPKAHGIVRNGRYAGRSSGFTLGSMDSR